MTIEEIAVQALARVSEFSNSVPGARSVMYRRIGVRQQQLFAKAARINPDYYGICATGQLDDGAADLADLVDPVEAADSIARIEIADVGTSAYTTGDRVQPVPVDDTDIEDPPRVTIRNRILRGVGSDLDGVVSLKIHYSRIPLPVAPTDGQRNADLEEPHVELLVVDLAKILVAKITSLSATVSAAVLGSLDAEEAKLLADFERHVAEYSGVTSSRFGSPEYQPARANPPAP